MRRLLVVMLAALAMVPFGSARAAVGVAATAPGSINYGYATPVVVSAQGHLTFVNTDLDSHDLRALDAYRPDGSASWCIGFNHNQCPLFLSDKIGTGEISDVLGLQGLGSGQVFKFFCTPHPWMVGTLVTG